MSDSDCNGQHRYFVCEVIGVEATGKVYPILACTACGHVIAPELTVAPAQTEFRLLKSKHDLPSKK